MRTINKITLLGRVGRMNDIKYTQAGKPIVSFSLATGDSYTDKATGQRVEKTQWHNVTVMSESLARVAQQYIAKGSAVYVEGELQTRVYSDKDGAPKLAVTVMVGAYGGNIVLLDAKKNAGEGDAAQINNVQPSAMQDDEIPF